MTEREPTSPSSEPDEAEKNRLRQAADDAAVEPWALLKAVRDPDGQVIDFVCQDINRLGAGLHGLQREDLLGRSVAEALPELQGSGLLDLYARCIETGEPLILDDLSYLGRTVDDAELQNRRYEFRAVRVESDYLSVNWRDVDERYWARQQVVDDERYRTRQQAQQVADSEERYGVLAAQLGLAHQVLNATVDSMLDPQMLLEAVRDPAGRVVDLRYREANEAAIKDMATTRDELIGRTVLELLPGFAESGPMSYYIQCLETGQPGALDDYAYDHEIQGETRRYDIRIAPAGKGLISLVFRDVTDRVEAQRRPQAARALLRASVDSMFDPQILVEAVRDPAGQVIDFTYRSVNRAFCSYRGWEERDIIGTSLLKAQPNLVDSGLFERYVHCVDTGEPIALDDVGLRNMTTGAYRHYDVRVVRAGRGLISISFRDVTDRHRAAEQLAASERGYRLLAENATDVVVHVQGGKVVWVSPSVADLLGAPEAYWIGRHIREVIPHEDAPDSARRLATLASGGTVQERIRVISMDGVTHWVSMRARPFTDDAGNQDGFLATLRLMDEEVAAEQAAEEVRRQKERADTLYRRSVDSAAVGMCLISPEGGFVEVNEAACEFFGYDAETLKSKTWQELTTEAYLEADLDKVADVLAGRIESYRMTKQYIHADGHLIWGDLSVGCLRDRDGNVEVFISQITDVTEETRARDQLVASEERNRLLAGNLESELESAARYVRAVLPQDVNGLVSVSSRYLPSSTLGGDFFDFRWIDDDHLIFYVLDVSGHGVRCALIAVAVDNLLRSLSREAMLEPDQVLAALNKLFDMEHHDDHYLTIFYGVYEVSTATLRYASGGHPPALLITGVQLTLLANQGPPIGAFEGAAFATSTVPVPRGGHLLVYTDGLYEIPRDGGGQWSFDEFVDSCSRLVATPRWSLDEIIFTQLRRSASGGFTDDCCLLRLTFN